MEIKQLNKVITPRFTYRFDLVFIIGDIDYHERVEIKADNSYLERFITFLDSTLDLYFDYKNKPVDYGLFCSENYNSEDDNDENDIFFWWPRDDWQHSELIQFEVTFFDGNGTEYNVEIRR